MQEVHVLIAGGGLSGISAAAHLLEAGERDLVVLEKEAELGGVWRDNTYPGCACDIPSHVYSFPFAPSRDWSRTYGERSEIQNYILRVAEERGVRDLVRFNAEVLEATWHEDEHRWIVRTADSVYAARILVIAVGGALAEPAIPDLPGLEQFEGTVFHSARWRNDHDLTGQRVAVVGTGASAIQFVPKIQPLVSHLTLLQRTPGWVLPKNDRAVSGVQKALLRLPGGLRLRRATLFASAELIRFGFKHPRLLQPLETAARKHLSRSVPSPELRAKLTPSYKVGCKRLLFSSDYYDALTKDNVDVVPAVSDVRRSSVVAADGSEHPVDTIIFATGFQGWEAPITRRVTGRWNQTIAEVWAGRPKAFNATSIAGFPNAFYFFGPNSALASAFMMADAQGRYLVEAVKAMRRKGLTMIDVRETAQDNWKRATDKQLSTQIWTAGGCTSFYLDVDGKNSALWPASMTSMRRELSRFPLQAYETAVLPNSRRADKGSGSASTTA
ncbi:flavin-containing monooxygenase [Mycolicibacterium moriokaense]|uniref:Cyclohexanone monooxygenase n=1 Tax=Mycolicibacterium moriokaense TaxID=39691 RepID=A0A318H7H5_9MYCO|nr:NAD(P)/FAD-dependent oxidoreductase [Mycolicibacterium moriokaense]PXX00357.1 cyclohexanone monooxygenase [Mycolicibacterium moriokaense]